MHFPRDFPEREYIESGQTHSAPALVFIIAAAMFSIRADVHSVLREEAMNFPKSADTTPASPPIQTRQSFQFQGSDPARNLQDFFERFVANRQWNDFVLETAQAAPSYRYEYAVETPTEDGIQYSLKVFSGEQEIATLENFNSVANTVDVHVYLGMHMRVSDVSLENVPKLLAELEKAHEKCSRPFGSIKKMTKIALRIAACLGGITAALSKYGIVETEP